MFPSTYVPALHLYTQCISAQVTSNLNVHSSNGDTCILTGCVEYILKWAFLFGRRRRFGRWPAEQRVPDRFTPQLCKMKQKRIREPHYCHTMFPRTGPRVAALYNFETDYLTDIRDWLLFEFRLQLSYAERATETSQGTDVSIFCSIQSVSAKLDLLNI